MEKIKLLLVEDEEMLAMIIKETLETRGFDIILASNGVEGWSRFKLDKPDICVIDIMMPRKDGLSLVEDIRKTDENIPVIFLTAKIQTADVLKGLEAGADDYMKKPFSMEELIMRLKNLVRRSNRQSVDTPNTRGASLTIGNYHLNYIRLELLFNNVIINLSQREADLLKLLIEHKNDLLERRTALLKIWGEENVFNTRSMDVYITRLRKYLLHDPAVEIINVRGFGYKLIE